MRKQFATLALLAVCLMPAAAHAATIDSSLIPDGTYIVKVEKVVDAKHVVVAMANGAETTLGAGASSVDFSKVKLNDQIKCSIVKGAVASYLDIDVH